VQRNLIAAPDLNLRFPRRILAERLEKIAGDGFEIFEPRLLADPVDDQDADAFG